MPTIAGHNFGPNGFCTFSCHNSERCCGRRFSDISMATKDDIGKPGWAHYGDLTATEYGEIEKERDRIWAAHQARDR